MRTKRSAQSVLAAFLLAFFVLSILPSPAVAHVHLKLGWPDEPEDPDFAHRVGGDRQRGGEMESHQTQPAESRVGIELRVLILEIHESLKLVWIP